MAKVIKYIIAWLVLCCLYMGTAGGLAAKYGVAIPRQDEPFSDVFYGAPAFWYVAWGTGAVYAGATAIVAIMVGLAVWLAE